MGQKSPSPRAGCAPGSDDASLDGAASALAGLCSGDALLVMREIILSNGVEIYAYAGDGFDGSSHVNVGYAIEHPDYHLFRNPTEVPIPKQDARKVAELLDWYVKQEMALRHSEGRIYLVTAMASDTLSIPTDLSSPYQATYFSGGLKRYASGRRNGRT
jgi:hypothetical protein